MAEELPQRVSVDDTICDRYDIADQPLVPGLSRMVLAGDHHGLGDIGMGGQCGFDLTGLDAESANLDLIIGPADEV